MAAMIQFMVSGRQYEFEKSKACQSIRKLVLNIKKAASIEKADTKISQRNYITVVDLPASVFETRKFIVLRMMLGYRCATAMTWDKLPAGVIYTIIERYKQFARKHNNPFYLGVALYGQKVLQQRGVS